MVLILRLLGQGCLRHSIRQERVEHQIGLPHIPPSCFINLRDFVAVPPTCSATILVAGVHSSVSMSKQQKAPISHWSIRLEETIQLTNLIIIFSFLDFKPRKFARRTRIHRRRLQEYSPLRLK